MYCILDIRIGIEHTEIDSIEIIDIIALQINKQNK